MNQSISRFKIINTLEGISFLVLLLIAMPAKYYLGEPLAVTLVGWVHGLLFIAYAIAANITAQKLHWSEKHVITLIIAGMIPFAFLFVHKKLSSLSRLA